MNTKKIMIGASLGLFCIAGLPGAWAGPHSHGGHGRPPQGPHPSGHGRPAHAGYAINIRVNSGYPGYRGGYCRPPPPPVCAWPRYPSRWCPPPPTRIYQPFPGHPALLQRWVPGYGWVNVVMYPDM